MVRPLATRMSDTRDNNGKFSPRRASLADPKAVAVGERLLRGGLSASLHRPDGSACAMHG
jgi:hypothetical protein